MILFLDTTRVFVQNTNIDRKNEMELNSSCYDTII